MHSQEKRDSRNSKVPRAFHALDPTFIKVITVLSKYFSQSLFLPPLFSFQLGTHPHFFEHRQTHLKNMSRGELPKTQPVFSIYRDLVHFIPIFHLYLYHPML